MCACFIFHFRHFTMVNKCVVIGCKSGYYSEKTKVPSFSFPFTKEQLLKKWIEFVNRKDWFPSKNSVVCLNHFDEKFINVGVERTKLKWKLDPIPTIYRREKEQLHYSQIQPQIKEQPSTSETKITSTIKTQSILQQPSTALTEETFTMEKQTFQRHTLKVKMFTNRKDLNSTQKTETSSQHDFNAIEIKQTNKPKKRLKNSHTPSKPLKILKVESLQKDRQIVTASNDSIAGFEDLSIEHAPPSYTCYKTQSEIVFYQLLIDQDTKFPRIEGAMKVDEDLHVQLQYREKPVPLPAWFVQRQQSKLTKFSMLKNFSSYLSSFQSSEKTLLDEFSECQYDKQNSTFSQQQISFALLLRNTSAPAYELLLQHFSLPSVSFLERLCLKEF